MESKKRKPLADISNTYNLRPVSALRQLVDASSNRNSRSNPPIPILKSGSSSTNRKPWSESSNRSVTSVGSSSNVNSARTSGTVHFQNPTRTISSTTSLGGSRNKDVASKGRQSAEKDKKEETTDVPIDSLSHVEKRKDKGKAIAPPFSSWVPMTKADFLVSNTMPIEKRKDKEKAVAVPFSSSVPGTQADTLVSDPTLSEKRKDKGKAISVPFGSLVPEGEGDVLILDPAFAEKRQDKGKAVVSDLLVPGKDADDLTFYQTPVDKRKDKGKAIDIPFSLPLNANAADEKNKDKGKAVAGSSMLEVMKDYQNGMHSPYSPLKKKMQQQQSGLWPVGGDHVDMIEGFGKDVLRTYTLSREKANIGKPAIHSASSSMGTREVTEKGEGIDRPSSSSVVQEKEIEKEIVFPPIVKEREKGKHLTLFNSLKKTGDKGKESSATVTNSRRPQKVKTKRGKTGAEASSCPPPRKTRNIQNDLDEVWNNEPSKSWTDPRPKSRKKRCTLSGFTDADYQDFLKQNEDYIKQKQAYFKEIDDEELIVEEVSQGESD